MFNMFLRACIIYIFVMLVMRLSGKVEVGRMQPCELLVSLLIADLASAPLADAGVPMLHAILPICALLGLELLFSALTLKNRGIRRLLMGEPAILMHQGRLCPAQLRRQRLCVDDLVQQLRTNGYFHLQEIDTVILEPNGQLSIRPWKKDMPPAAGEMDLSVTENGICRILVSDGQLSRANLAQSGHDMRWLRSIMQQQGVSHLRDILVLTVDGQDDIFLQKKEDGRL